ncbi:pre-mRNA cleavage complex 2 protein Pcf11-like isoform X1 [Dinothrombium tinctorium]|uniref:Pre-mRNA cleavage complex 2 protein Pcf11-like isoform X1 n=1 Tax=Dinothrombium tinctorium TaxID=1965070 RepID=A0A3S3NE56_9ACAR|nr:pre-mRNA cleavage complex 2 protein Pcf11-like isoform X1 [Dinothrombium tinctorium]
MAAKSAEESEAISEYRSSLNDLSFNSKPLINMLTMLADDYKDTAAPEIVKCIEQRMHSVSPDKKLPLLYLMDSICKNINGVYVKLFTQNIVSTFCHVFEKADEKTRLSLYKLRQTWNDIFPARKLYAVDVRIQQSLDPAWPVTAQKPDNVSAPGKSGTDHANSNANNAVASKSAAAAAANKVQRAAGAKLQQQVHVNPKFLNENKQVKQISLSNSQSSLPLPPETITAQLYQKHQELLRLEKQRMDLEILTEKKKLEEKARALREREEKLKKKEETVFQTEEFGYKKRGRKRQRSHQSRSPSPIVKKNRSPQPWTRQNMNKSRSRSPHVQWEPQRQKGTPSPNRVRRSPHVANVGENVISKNNSLIGTPHRQMIVGSHPVEVPPVPTVPTTIPAPAILAQTDIRSLVNLPGITSSSGGSVNLLNVSDITSISCAPLTAVTTSIAQVASVIPPPVVTESLNWCQDRDYRREFEAVMFEADQRLRSGALSSHDHDMLVREMERAMHQNISQEIAPAFRQENLCVTPELTMLVDGKSRKLYYLDDSIAVVLMNGPPNLTFNDLIKMDPAELNPRQISFEGKPTKVFIDSDRGSNEFVLLEFNNQPQTFFHNEHEQRIKFGGPAKEIILNGKAYQAKFGGPPVEVWFAGDTLHPHSLRLDSPPPRVKLSDQPRIDLWNQIINKATKKPETPKEVTKPAETSEPPVNINELLQKLINAGIINKNISSQDTIPHVESVDTAKTSLLDSNSNPNLPPEPPLKLSSDSLKIPRPSVIASLYNGIQCTNCSLRFDDKENTPTANNRKTNYSKHLDWHFRQNRKDKAKPSALAASLKRGWYYNLNLWLQFKEVSDDDETNVKKLFDEEQEVSNEESSVLTVAASSDESKNQCSVCCERFDLIWVEEEEEWRLKNAITHIDDKNYHPLCLDDLLNQQQQQQQQQQEAEESIAESHKIEGELDSQKMIEIISQQVQSVEMNQEEEMTVSKHESDLTALESDVAGDDTLAISDVKPELTSSEKDETMNAAEVAITDESMIKREETVSVLKNEKEIKESPLRLEITPCLVSKENKLTMNLKSKLCPVQKETQLPQVPLAKKEDKEIPVIQKGVEKSALCAIM